MPLLPVTSALFQLLEPVQHNVQLRGCSFLLVFHHHQQPLTVRRNVIVWYVAADARIWGLKEQARSGNSKGWPRFKTHGHYFVAVSIKYLATRRCPQRLVTSFRGDLPLCTQTRERLHVHLALPDSLEV